MGGKIGIVVERQQDRIFKQPLGGILRSEA
jgi:hypothetical protein